MNTVSEVGEWTPAGLEDGRVFALVVCSMPSMKGIGADGGEIQILLHGGTYLAEMEADTGAWRLFAKTATTDLFWPVASARVTTETLEAHFGIDSEVYEGDAYDLFAVALPRDSRTYEVKEDLKALGARWLPDSKMWLVPSRCFAQAQALVAGVGNANEQSVLPLPDIS